MNEKDNEHIYKPVCNNLHVKMGIRFADVQIFIYIGILKALVFIAC